MIKLNKIKPLFNFLVTTMDKYKETQFIPGTNLIDTTKIENRVKEYQTVLAVGSAVRDIKVGDVVCIDPKNYAVFKYKKGSTQESMEEYKNTVVGYSFPVVELEDTPCLLLTDRDIQFVVESYKEVPDDLITKN